MKNNNNNTSIIPLSELREHLTNFPNYKYFINDIEIVGVTSNYWYYDKNGGTYLGKPDTKVIVKKG